MCDNIKAIGGDGNSCQGSKNWDIHCGKCKESLQRSSASRCNRTQVKDQQSPEHTYLLKEDITWQLITRQSGNTEVISQPFHLTMETERKLQKCQRYLVEIMPNNSDWYAEVKSVFASVTYSEIVVYGKPDWWWVSCLWNWCCCPFHKGCHRGIDKAELSVT